MSSPSAKRFRVVAALPWLGALAVVLVGSTKAAAASDVVMRIPLDAVRLLAVVGCAAAALAFERGERLRLAWLLHAAGMLLLFGRDMTLAFGVTGPRLLNALVLVANGCAVSGTWILARTWRFAGIALPGSAGQQRAITVGAVGLALAIAGGSLVVDLRTAIGGNPQGIVDFVSRASDVVELALVAPIVLTALAMRGGVLWWPWVLFTTSLACWIFYDAAGTITAFFSVPAATIHLPREVLRTLACAYLGAAGLAQRLVVRPVD